ncbi:MAG: type IV pilus assembly protein PilM [Minisyncoccia bacterium]
MAFGLSSFTSFFRSEENNLSPKDGVLGIDIGSSAIKIVKLKEVRGVPTLETYGELQLGPYEGVDVGRTTHLTEQKTIEALVDILREAGATGKSATFAISYNSSFTTTIDVPTLDIEKIASIIPVEARKYIPISLTKIALNWTMLGADESEKTTKVALTATYNDAVTRYNTIMQGSGLYSLGSEVEIASSVRASVDPKDDRVAVLDFGASSTRLYIVEKGVVTKTHSVLMSGFEITKALENALGIEFKDAEELKRTVGLLGSANDPRVQKTIAQEIERGLREIHTVMVRYEEVDGIKIQKVILNGSGGLLKGLSAYVGDMFSRPVLMAEPFSKIAYPVFLEDVLKESGPTFGVAIGVALHAFQKNG